MQQTNPEGTKMPVLYQANILNSSSDPTESLIGSPSANMASKCVRYKKSIMARYIAEAEVFIVKTDWQLASQWM